MKAWINGLGWITPAGYGQGRQTKTQPLQSGELTIPTRKDLFSQIDRRFGRLDDFSRIGLAAITFCLRDAKADQWQEKRPFGIIAASRYGCLQTDIAYLETMLAQQGKLASPNLFAYTLPNSFLGEAALRFGLTGNSMVINRRDPTQLLALQVGLEELAWSEQSGVLAGVVDLLPPPELAEGDDFSGSLFLLLEREQRAGCKPYGLLGLTGSGLVFNGTRLTGLQALLTACLDAVSDFE